MNQLKFCQVLGTALTLAMMGGCNSSGSDDAKSAPPLTITDAPSITIANVESYSLGGTCTGVQGEQSSVVKVVLGSNNLGSPACENGAWAVSAHDVSGIADSDDLKLTVTHGANEASQTLIKDTQKPKVTLETPAIINSINQSIYSALGTCSDVGQDVVVSIGGLETSVNCIADGWSFEGYNVSSLTVANVSVSVNMKDAVGNPADEVSVSVGRNVGSPTVTITTTDFKVSIANKASYVLDGRCSENGRDVVLKIAGLSGKTFSCSSLSWSFREDVSALGEGSGIELSVEQEDVAGNRGVVKATLAKDTLAPVIGLNGGQVVNASTEADFKLKGTCSEQGKNMTVAITGLNPVPTLNPVAPPCDGTSWEATLSSNAGEGTASVVLTQDDSFGNRGTATGTFIKDTTLSNPAFDANLDITGANFKRYIIRGTCPEDGTVSLTIPSQTPASISCAGGYWAHASIDTTSWTDNTYTLSATLTDTAGNRGGSVSKSVSKDTTSLAVDINTPTPINAGNKNNYAVSGGCSSHVGTLTVSVRGETPTTQPSCSSRTWNTTVDVSTVSDNPAVAIRVSFTSDGITVRADTTVLKDILPPILMITAPSAINSINQRSYSVSGTCPGADQSIQVVIGNLNFDTSCVSNSWTLGSKDVSSLTTSPIAITADTTDVAGNAATQARASVVRDVIAPVLTITTANLNINVANVTAYTLDGSCQGREDVTVTIGNLSGVAVPCASDAWTLPSKDMSTLNDGAGIAVSITQDDAVGNHGTLSATLDKDVIAPVLTLTSSLLVSSSNVNIFPMAGACGENGTGAVRITIASGAPASVDCQSGRWQKNVNLTSEAEGNISVNITHQDALGNGTTITATLSKDSIAPTLTITLPVGMNSANQKNYPIAGTCNDESAQITVTIQGQSGSLSSACGSSAWTVSEDFTSLADNNAISITASIQDTHGNTTTKRALFSKDATPPEVTINTLAELTDANQAAFPLTGSCNENTGKVVVSANGTVVPGIQPTCASSGWTTRIDLSTLGGDITIRAHQVDSAGNTGNAPVRIIRRKRETFLHSKIALGDGYSCALTSEGGVKCWGEQYLGRLGNNRDASGYILYPMNVVGPDTDTNPGGDGILGNIIQIIAGRAHTCALNPSGNVLCWGTGLFGVLGNNATGNSSFPVQVVGPDTNNSSSGDGILGNIVQVNSGGSHSCALNSSGNVLCWGRNIEGQLGDDSIINRSYPAFVVGSDGNNTPLIGVVQLSLGGSHTCALTSAGKVLCWGYGGYGQLGSSSRTDVNLDGHVVGVNRDAPHGVLTAERGPPLSEIAQIASGVYNTCALTLDGYVKCWGRRSGGALGDNGGVTGTAWFPVDVVGGDGSGLLSDIVQITLGDQSACALNAQNKVWCWGDGGDGRLGNGSTDNKNYPVAVIAGSGSSSSLDGIVEIASFTSHSCALSEEGRVRCWGNGFSGQLGYGGTSSHKYYPVTVIPASGSADFFNIATYRGSYTCVSGTCALNPIGLSLASGSSSPSASNTPSIVVSGTEVGKTLNLYSSDECSGSSEGSTSPIALSALTEGTHRYYFDITDSSSNRSDCSKSFISYIYDNAAPSAPTLGFTTASDTDTTPDISVSAMTPGDLVQVYSNNGCSTAAAPATRVEGVSHDITLNAISGSAGDYNFYATATDAAGNVSACSTSAATYTLNDF